MSTKREATSPKAPDYHLEGESRGPVDIDYPLPALGDNGSVIEFMPPPQEFPAGGNEVEVTGPFPPPDGPEP